MNSIFEIDELMIELIENTKAHDDFIEFSDRACEIIEEISEYAKGTKLFSSNQHRSENFWGPDATPTEIYCYMLEKVVEAPTQIRRDTVVILHMPALAAALCRGIKP